MVHAHESANPLSKRTGLAIAFVVGCLLGMSAAPFHWVATAWFYFAAMLWLLERSASVRDGTLFGWAAGFGCSFVALYWNAGMLVDFGGFPWVAAVLVSSLLWLSQGLAFGAAAWSSMALRSVAPLWLTLPATTAICFSLIPSLFPFRPTSGQVAFLPIVQIADIGGLPILDLLIGTTMCALYRGLIDRRRELLALSALCFLIPFAYGHWRINDIESQRAEMKSIRVGVVQPNVGIWEKRDRSLATQHLNELLDATAALEQGGADLVVWPESAFPYAYPRSQRRDFPAPMSVHQRGASGPLLYGAITSSGGCDRWNSVLAMDEHGAIVGVSDKVELLAFGEYVPFWHELSILQDNFRCPGMTPGTESKTLELAGGRVGVLNCYEDVLPRYGREVIAGRPDWLVNVTNDAWFGDTTEPELHHMIARMRSVQTRRDLVRAVNTGVSAHVSATGEDLVHTQTWIKTRFIAEVKPLQILSFWVQFGDWLTPALVGMLVGVAFARRRR